MNLRIAISLALGIFTGIITATVMIAVFTERHAVTFAPNRMMFACLKQQSFGKDSGTYSWRVESGLGGNITVVGTKFFGRLSPIKVVFNLDESLFELPTDKSLLGSPILFSDIRFKSGAGEPACQADDTDVVNFMN